MSITAPSLFSLVFIFIGGAIITYAIKISAKARQSLSWPSTEGEIAHSAVLYETGRTSTGEGTATYKQVKLRLMLAALWLASVLGIWLYRADISYRYKVKGANYSSSRIALLDLPSIPGVAQSIVQRYPDKSRVQVYYNPSDFSEAVLEPRNTAGIKYLYFAGGIIAAGGLFSLLISLTGHASAV